VQRGRDQVLGRLVGEVRENAVRVGRPTTETPRPQRRSALRTGTHSLATRFPPARFAGASPPGESIPYRHGGARHRYSLEMLGLALLLFQTVPIGPGAFVMGE